MQHLLVVMTQAYTMSVLKINRHVYRGGVAPVQLTLTASNGLITLPSTVGLTFTIGANGQANFTVRGT